MKFYGIKNCNRVRKAMDDLCNVEYDFLDIKKIDRDVLREWTKQRSLEEFVNTKGLTAKKLGLKKERIKDLSYNELEEIVLANPSCIKRPIIENNGKVYVAEEYREILK